MSKLSKAIKKLENKSKANGELVGVIRNLESKIQNYDKLAGTRLDALTRELAGARLEIGNLQDKVGHLQRQVEYVLVPVVSTGIPHRIDVTRDSDTLWSADGSTPIVVASSGVDLNVTVSRGDLTRVFRNGQEVSAVYATQRR